jgi:hypothetical protein
VILATALLLSLLCGDAVAGDGVPVEVSLDPPVKTHTRIELLVRDDGSPHWVLVDAGVIGAGGTRTLRTTGGRRAILLVRGNGPRTYSLDGPFAWPREPGSRRVRGEARRTLTGSDPAAKDLDLRIAGPAPVPDPLCDGDGSGWRCLGVPAGFAGRVFACVRGSLVGSAAVRPDSEDAVSLRRVPFAAELRVSGPDGETVDAGVRVVRSIASGGFVRAADEGARVAILGPGIAWLEATAEPAAGADLRVEVTAASYATRRLPLGSLPSVCAGPLRVELERAVEARGFVVARDGRPAAGALVLVRAEDAAREPTILADATADAEGAFALPGLEPRAYRLLACQAELGCREERISPGEPIRIVLGDGGDFTGRVLSSAGVPEVEAAVRIVPLAADWAAAADRVRKLPLQTTTGPDGRFRIAAPEPGEFRVEARGASGGVARAVARRRALSTVTIDLGDLRISEPIEFTARLPGCGGGALAFSGPLGGETSLPDVARFPLDPSGAARVRLGEPGAWAAWATCAGRHEAIDPSLLPEVASVDGGEIEFKRAGELPESP